MKFKKIIFAVTIFSVVFLESMAIAAPYTQDTGKIKTLFVSAGGAIAITLDGGFPNARTGGQCAAANDFAGFATADPALKSALIAAKAAQQSITVTVAGCSGGWFNIADIYIN